MSGVGVWNMTQRILVSIHHTIPTIIHKFSHSILHKIKWWCFCFQVHHRNSVRLCCESVIYRCKVIVCIYKFDLTQSTDNSTRLYLRQSNLIHPLSRGLIMVEVEGIAPSSCPSFDLYQQIVIYLYHRGILIVKRFFYIP